MGEVLYPDLNSSGSRPSYLAAVLTGVVGVLLSIAAFAAVAHWEARLAQLKLKEAAENHQAAINGDLESATNALYTLRAFMHTAGHVGRAEFQAFAQDLRSHLTGLRNVGWTQRVSHEDRDAFERSMRAQGYTNFQIWERDAQGNRVRASDRSEYFPSVFSEPDKLTPELFGFDIASESERREAQARARVSRQPVATPPIRLISKQVRGGFITYIAVYPKSDSNQANAQNPIGFLAAVYDTSVMIDRILAAKTLPSGVDIYVFNPKARGDDRFIFWHSSRTRATPAPVPSEEELRRGLHFEAPIRVADQEWAAIFAPAPVLIASIWSWQSAGVLLVGFVMTGMIVAYLMISARRTVRLEASRARYFAERERARSAEMIATEESARAREIAARFDAALSNMSEGLSFFDAHDRLIICNRRYVEMYDLPPERVQPGISLREIFALRPEVSQPSDEQFLRFRATLAANEQFKARLDLKDGRFFEIQCQRAADGAWVATHEDITAQFKAQKSLGEAKANAERAEAEARAAHATLLDALDVVPEGLAVFDAQDRLVLWNRPYSEIYGFHEMAPGIKFEELLRRGLARGQYTDALGREEQWLKERLAQHALPKSTFEQRLAGDRWLRIEERRMTQGGTIGVRIDITELKRREFSFRLLFEESPLPMWVVDLESLRLIDVNAATCRHYGYSREQLLSMSVGELRIPEEREQLRQRFRNFGETWVTEGTCRHVTADGRIMHVAVEARRLKYNGRDACVAVAFDMTERKRVEEQITFLARHDPLTQLANRTVFMEDLELAFDETRRCGSAFTVLLLDLDGFKHVNDSLGHPAGDALLRSVAERLRACCRSSETVARMGGDEFAVLTTAGGDQRDAAVATANRLLDALALPCDIEGHHIDIDASIGIALAPEHGTDVDQLMKSADLALYKAKAEGRDRYRIFEDAMAVEARARRALLVDLRKALTNDEFELHYHPIVDLKTMDVASVEALIRWRHPQRGMITPGDFIPLAEETDLINPIGEWVLRKAFGDAVAWPSHIKVSVNLSPIQFRNVSPIEILRNALSESGLAPDRVETEITESVLLHGDKENIAALHEVQRMGVSIVLDDFGTGYSSLSYLRMFPFDKIKIDRSFVHELSKNADSASIVSAVANLGRSLRIGTVAEGVETEDQLVLVRAAGCTHAQGFLFGHPCPAAELSFRRHRARKSKPKVA